MFHMPMSSPQRIKMLGFFVAGMVVLLSCWWLAGFGTRRRSEDQAVFLQRLRDRLGDVGHERLRGGRIEGLADAPPDQLGLIQGIEVACDVGDRVRLEVS